MKNFKVSPYLWFAEMCTANTYSHGSLMFLEEELWGPDDEEIHQALPEHTILSSRIHSLFGLLMKCDN